jgi:endonuclease YncB( thermonuclease family)
MSVIMRGFFLLFLCAISVFSYADIFYWEDEQGKKHFSDRKHKDAVKLSIIPTESYYQIKKIYDGDTILLANGTKLRLLGINTPEVSKRDKIADEGGEEAKQWLIEKLQGSKIKLRYDLERKDKYGRVLAHVFTKNNEHINLQLVENGLAIANIYPPNLKYVDKLIAAQQQAESQKLGLWAMSAYKVKNVEDFDSKKHRGWQRIRGTVTQIKQARKYNYLYFSPQFALKIARSSEKLFGDLNGYLGKTIEARGWVRKNKQHYHLLIRHPSAIKILK